MKSTNYVRSSGLLSAALACVLSNAAVAELKPGATGPLFNAPAAFAGDSFEFSLADALKKGPVVVYFYPKAFTHGCTIEANLFAEASDEFKALNATVIGVSGDNMPELKEFSKGPCGGKFAVASDADKKIMKSYDATMTMMPGVADRISYVITPDDKVLYTYNSMSPDQHVSNTLAAIEKWKHDNKK